MPQTLTAEQKALQILTEFMESEFGDYSFHWKIEPTEVHDGKHYFDLRYGLYEDSNNYISMRVDPSKEFENVEVDQYEDAWHVVETFNWTIKYFWMVVKWE